jgi:hypothetical protein
MPSAASPPSHDLDVNVDGAVTVLVRSSGNMTRQAAIAELASASKKRAISWAKLG